MNGMELDRIHAPVLRGEVLETDEDYLRAVYDKCGIEDSLGRYLDGGSVEDDAAIETGMQRFSLAVAATATKRGGIDIDIVRAGFEILTSSMNDVASRKYGYAYQGTFRKLLVRAGMAEPEPDKYVRYLDDRYWSVQFMEQYENGHMATRRDGESEEHYLARYSYVCMRGLLYAPFSYLAGGEAGS